MSSSGSRSGRGGGRAGGGGGRRRGREDAEEAWRVKFIRSVGGKRRAAKKYSNWDRPQPDTLVDYAPGGAYFDELPPMPPMPAAFAREEEAMAAWKRARGGGDLVAGEGSSRGGGGAGRELFAGEPEALVFARTDEEEEAMAAEAMAASKAELAQKQEEAEEQEKERAIAEVAAFKAREASSSTIFVD